MKGCNPSATAPGEETDNNAVFLVRSLQPDVMSVREGFKRFNIVAYRDYIFQNRQGLNSLRQSKSPIQAPRNRTAEASKPGAQAELFRALRQEEASLLGEIGRARAQLARVRGAMTRFEQQRRPNGE